ncbi:hypothetical protein Tco_1070195 [Tanacetum coccineum]|uniref:Uncharacterized protein n=1 Tax=Tanacetum coccineum TaxID=301880 RepID=A0ABQ5HMW3_9ASTR
MPRAFPMSLTGAASHWLRNKPSAIQAQLNNLGREIKKVNEKVYVDQVGCEQCKGGGYRATALGFYQRNNANLSYQERRQSMEETLSKFMGELAKGHEENFNLIIEIQASITLMYETRQTTIPFPSRLYDYYCKEKKGSYGLNFRKLLLYEASHIDNSIPQKEKDPELVDSEIILKEFVKLASRKCAKIDVFKRKITLIVREEKIIFKSVKPASSLIKRVYMLGLRERMELDLEARLIGETLVLNRSLDPFFEDYIELNDLNVPLELRRDQVDNLMPTIEEGEVIEEFRARNDDRMVSKFFGYPSDCDHDKKIHIDCAYNLKFSCMIDFAILKDMNDYRNEGMGDVIFGEPFLKEVGINAKWFKRMIIIYNGNEEVSEEDMMNEISHSYQKLKSFYKEVLNLGPEYV